LCYPIWIIWFTADDGNPEKLPPGWITDSNDAETEMVDVAKMFENFNLAILASDANFKVIYQDGNSGQDGNPTDQ
jgi:hypothetical protein